MHAYTVIQYTLPLISYIVIYMHVREASMPFPRRASGCRGSDGVAGHKAICVLKNHGTVGPQQVLNLLTAPEPSIETLSQLDLSRSLNCSGWQCAAVPAASDLACDSARLCSCLNSGMPKRPIINLPAVEQRYRLPSSSPSPSQCQGGGPAGIAALRRIRTCAPRDAPDRRKLRCLQRWRCAGTRGIWSQK